MTDEDVINRLHAVTGVGTVHYRGKPSQGRRPVWGWAVRRRSNVVALDELLAPLLLGRRRETVAARLVAASRGTPVAVSLEPDSPGSWAWVAGLIEGEGWMAPGPSSARRSPVVAAESTDQDVLERLAALTGVGTIVPVKNRKPGVWKPSARWSVSDRSDVRHVVCDRAPSRRAPDGPSTLRP
jgi:hypothetical protein